MNWVCRFDERALQDLKKLGRTAQREILAYLDERVAGKEGPRDAGKALKVDVAGLWRYRVGECRLTCQIKEGDLMVAAVSHRKGILCPSHEGEEAKTPMKREEEFFTGLQDFLD